MPERCHSLVLWPAIKTLSGPSTFANSPHYLSLSSASLLTLFFLPTQPPMKTHAKNASKHPAAPDMTPAQLAAAGIPQPKHPQRKPTKDQRIAALEEDLRMARELLQMVSRSHPLSTLLRWSHLFMIHRIMSLGQLAALERHQGHQTPFDTDPATDDDDDDNFAAAGSRKRSHQKPVSGARYVVLLNSMTTR